jgi:hypothetical protein
MQCFCGFICLPTYAHPMKKLFHFTIIILAMFSLYACGEQCCSTKSIECVGYTDAVGRSWIPYNNKGNLIFVSSGGQHDTLTYDSVSVTAPYTSQKQCSNNVCDANLRVFGSGIKSLYCFHQLAQTNSSGISNSSIVQISFLSCNLQADSIAPTGLVNVRIGSCQATTSFSPQLSLNGISFSNVQEITADSLSACVKGNPLRKIWLGRGRGLIGYQTIVDNNVWALQ